MLPYRGFRIFIILSKETATDMWDGRYYIRRDVADSASELFFDVPRAGHSDGAARDHLLTLASNRIDEYLQGLNHSLDDLSTS